jgi:hypothetical protein
VGVTFGPPIEMSDLRAASKAEQHRLVTGRIMRALADLLGQQWSEEG